MKRVVQTATSGVILNSANIFKAKNSLMPNPLKEMGIIWERWISGTDLKIEKKLILTKLFNII